MAKLTFDEFQKVDIPVKHGLPAFAYTSKEFQELENRSLFPGSWVFVAFAHKLEKAGDVHPISIGENPVFLVRNESGEIRAFHNACRHRCLKLVEQTGNCGKLIRCPYHSWSYNLDGELKAAPYFGGHDRDPPPEFSLASHGLVPVRCETWHDWVFINLDGSAQEFDSFIAPLRDQLKSMQIDEIRPVATIDLGMVRTNWKFLMENFIEPYHVQFVHKTTTKQPLTDHHTIIDRHCLGSACDIDENEGVDTSSMLAVTSRYLTLFPNFVIGTYAPDQVGVHLNIPVGIDKTRQFRVIYVHRNSDITDEQIGNLEMLWTDVHREDHAICERLQEGRQSKVAEQGGYLSPFWEDSVRRFQELVVDATMGT